MIPEDGFIAKGDVRSTPYGNRIGKKAFDGLKDPGGDRKIEGKRSHSHNLRVQALKGSLQSPDWRPAKLHILQNNLMACLFQSSGQIEEPEGHSKTFANRVGRIDKQYMHRLKEFRNSGIKEFEKIRN
jgi:hypothetical protein